MGQGDPPSQDTKDIVARTTAAILAACDPAAALERNWPTELDALGRVILIAAGKAAAPMASFAIKRLGQRITGGAVVTIPEHTLRVESAARTHGASVQVLPADHPLPTARSAAAAQAVAHAAGLATEQDTVIALISGGASAHLALPADGVSIDDLQALTHHLQLSGADITELNTVRKHAELLKGGNLARLAWPAPVRALILSDVLGDKLPFVGSGPFSPDDTTFAHALAVLNAHNARRVSPSITARLVRGARGEETDTPTGDDDILSRTKSHLVGSNRLAIDAAAAAAAELGCDIERTEQDISGEAAHIGDTLGALLKKLADKHPPPRARGRAIILGGETTVTVSTGDDPNLDSDQDDAETQARSTATGGPCQELALAAAAQIAGIPGALVIALSTDGIDGPTPAAGAFATGDTLLRLQALGIDPVPALARHDTHPVLAAADHLITTGHTATNVNDVYLALLLPDPS